VSGDRDGLRILEAALATLREGFRDLPAVEEPNDADRLAEALDEAARYMRDNYPYHHPLYVGQMLKPPHKVARLAYALAMVLNPNNHALDGGRASSRMEKEAVAAIARMFGWTAHLGHLCGGGTMANLEALWIGREIAPRKTIAASMQAHYTHERVCRVLGVPFVPLPVDARGRMDVAALEYELASGRIGTVVATVGTTGAGAVDPLPEILEACRKAGVRVHVDAAYGGYFTLVDGLDSEARLAFDAIGGADSIVIDPHKHGLQPYGCGCILYRDAAVGRFYLHDSPYTYFSSDEMHLGEISLECSRPGASAVALWTTMRLLPLVRGGEFARGLASGRKAALALHRGLRDDGRLVPLFPPELDIVVAAARASTASSASATARRIFDEAAAGGLHLALATFPRGMVEPARAITRWDANEVVCLRLCAMKPEHAAWVPEILKRLCAALDSVAEGDA
jgi:tyrosine decarboxylase / aspartate 1-decarboxylase